MARRVCAYRRVRGVEHSQEAVTAATPGWTLVRGAYAAGGARVGFKVVEIKGLLATGGHPPVRALAAQKRDQLRDRARELNLLADLIDHFVDCPSANAFECEHFQRGLRQALPFEGARVHAGDSIPASLASRRSAR